MKLTRFLLILIITLSIIIAANAFIDSAKTEFDKGKYYQIHYNTTNSALQLDNSTYGTYTSQIFDSGEVKTSWNSINWSKGLPYGKELPNWGVSESGANMTGNILLMHLNEISGTIADSSGNGNNGTQFGNVAYSSAGKFDSAIQFDGRDDFINVTSASLRTPNNFTVEAWIYSNGTTIGSIFDAGGGGQGYFMSLGNGYIQIYEYSGGWTSTRAKISSGWHHIAGTRNNGGKLRIYVDGAEKSSINSAGIITFTVKQESIGARWSASAKKWTNFFNGNIDEIAIWNRSLSAEEILDHYKRGALNLNLSAHSCDDTNCEGDAWIEVTNSPAILSIPNNRYFNYKAEFSTENLSYSPELYNVSIDYTILNRAPSINIATINSTYGNSYTTEDLWCTFTPIDPDPEEILTANIEWYKNNSSFYSTPESVSPDIVYVSKLLSGNLTAGDEWLCSIQVCDDDLECSGPINSTNIIILAQPSSPPQVSSGGRSHKAESESIPISSITSSTVLSESQPESAPIVSIKLSKSDVMPGENVRAYIGLSKEAVLNSVDSWIEDALGNKITGDVVYSDISPVTGSAIRKNEPLYLTIRIPRNLQSGKYVLIIDLVANTGNVQGYVEFRVINNPQKSVSYIATLAVIILLSVMIYIIKKKKKLLSF